jgi:hypothetical protein
MEWIAPLILTVGLVLLFASGSSRRAADGEQARRLRDVERKLDLLLLEHLGIVVPEPEAPAGVVDELMAGRKIQAIKAYREATGLGLKDAKDAVEALARQRGLD